MGLLENIFFRELPTPRNVKLDLDLPGGRLGEIQLGDPADSIITKLGPPISWWYMKSQGSYIYPKLGVSVTTDNALVSEFAVAPDKPQYCDFLDLTKKWKPYEGKLRLIEGGPLHKAGEITPELVREILGTPHETQEDDLDKDDGELVLMYRNRYPECDVEFTPDMRLKALRTWMMDDEEGDEDEQDDNEY